MGLVMGKRRFLLIAGLGAVVLGTVATGVYFEQYFMAFVFTVWVGVECLFWRFSDLLKASFRGTRMRVQSMGALMTLYGKNDVVSERHVAEQMARMKRDGELTPVEERWMTRLRDLMTLRSMAFGPVEEGKKGLRQALTFTVVSPRALFESVELMTEAEGAEFVRDVGVAATHVSDLYWKLYDTAIGDYPDLSRHARDLYRRIFGLDFDPQSSREAIGRLTDAIGREQGVPFLILNLIRTENSHAGRSIAQSLLTADIEMDQDIRSGLYWIAELHWFTQENKGILPDHESTIRYLYHLCFTNPERAGFLEIDSQFFSQFETVNEVAREGFLFKETLIEKILMLWKDHEGYFDATFQSVLEAMTSVKSKVYDERETWALYWNREHANFSRDYLYVVEGNLSYASGQYEDARVYFEKALKINSSLRSALLNIVFCYARLGKEEMHDLAVEKMLVETALFPSSLYVAANSYLIARRFSKADEFYNQLAAHEGWERKVDYYKSTFCFENGLYELALKHAKKAHELNPHDSSMSYHLSLCFNAMGEKDQALTMVKRLDDAPEWLNYYRFTLERDAGRHHEASETLMQISSDYFQDPEELEAALDFARDRKDLVLLRHLRNR